jgi:hypothetical protein
LSFATCYGTHNCRCTIEGWLKVLGRGSKESSWKKKKKLSTVSGEQFSCISLESSRKLLGKFIQADLRTPIVIVISPNLRKFISSVIENGIPHIIGRVSDHVKLLMISQRCFKKKEAVDISVVAKLHFVPITKHKQDFLLRLLTNSLKLEGCEQ